MKLFLRKSLTTTIWIVLFVVLLFTGYVLEAEASEIIPFRHGKSIDILSNSSVDDANEIRSFGFDWNAPQVSVRNPIRTLNFKNTEFSTITNEPVDIRGLPDSWKFDLIATEYEPTERFHYLIKTSDLATGEYEYALRFLDENLNETTLRLKLTVPEQTLEAPDWQDPKYFMPADSLLAIANKEYRLPADYIPTSLVALADYDINYANDAKVRQIVISDLKQMTNAISAAGIPYTITSAYRSYLDQFNAYDYWLGFNDGDIEATDSVSARPGHSEHQLGLTTDFVTSENGGVFWQFENTRLARWLAENAWRYGFVMSYPKGKEDITGYSFEPWHYRYIGKENASKQRQSGLTLTEWLYQQNAEVLQSDNIEDGR